MKTDFEVDFEMPTKYEAPLNKYPYSHITRPAYKEGEVGNWRLKKSDLPGVIRGYHTGLQVIEDARKENWVLYKGDTLWMSVSPAEMESQDVSLRHCEGTVALFGLGMGICLWNLIRNPKVTEVHVVEIDQTVFALNMALSNVFEVEGAGKIIRHNADAREWSPPEGVEIDHVSADFWPDWCNGNMPSDMAGITKRCKPNVASWWSMEMSFVDWCRDKKIPIPDIDDRTWVQWGDEIGVPVPEFEGRLGKPSCNQERLRLVTAFKDLTKEQRNSMSAEEWAAVPPEEKKSCHDCRFLKGYVSLWCVNEDAAKWRGSKIPGGCLCKFWEPLP